MLSKYCGSGDSAIDIIIPEGIVVSEGVVYFSYGDGDCGLVDVDIYDVDSYVIQTNPSYEICNGKKTIFFTYKESGETFFVDVECAGEWSVSTQDNDISFVIYDTGFMIIVGNANEYTMTLYPNDDDVDSKYNIEVKLKKAGT